MWRAATRTQTDNSVDTERVFADNETQGAHVTQLPAPPNESSPLRSLFPSRVDLFANSSGYYSNRRVNSQQPAASWSVYLRVRLLMYFQQKERRIFSQLS